MNRSDDRSTSTVRTGADPSRRKHTGTAAVVVTAVAVVVTLVACAPDRGETAAPGQTVATAPGLPPADPLQTLPPNDIGAMRRLYDPVLEERGLKLTRASLIDRSAGGYERSNQGTHLALYVEPVTAFTGEQFTDGLWDLAALFTPDAFARWSDLTSFDICQEPNPGDDDREEPFPVTQIDITREAAAQIDWTNGTLVDLLVAEATVPGTVVRTGREVRTSPNFVAARREAQERIAASGMTTTTRYGTATTR